MGTLHIGGGTYKNPIKPKKPKKKKHTDKPKNQAGGSRVGGGAGSYKGSTGKVSSPKHKSATQKGGLGASTTQFLHSAAAHQQVSKSNAAYKVSNSKTSPLTTSHKYKLHTTGSGSTGASYKATSPKGLSKAEAKANADALAKQNKGSQHYTTTKNDSGKGVGGTDFSKAVLNSEGNTKSSSNLLGKSANVYTAKETSDHTARTSKAGKTNYYVNGTFDKNGKFNEGSKKSPTVTKVNKKTYDTVLAREGGDQSLGMTGRLAGNIASHAKSSVMSTAGAADRMTSSKANTYTYTDKNGTAHKAVSTGQLTLGQQAKPQKAQRTQIKKNYVSKAKRVEKSQNNLALEYAKQANYKKGQSALGRLALDTTGQMTEMGIDYLAGAVVAGTAGAVVGRALASAIGANGALTNMGLRSFTGGYDQAIADGATEKEANVFGWINAATEVATEKMWNVGSGFEKLYGKGVMNLDKFIPTASGRFVKSKTGKEIVSGLKTLGLSGGTEALEEIVGNGIEDSLAYVTYQKQIGERDMKALDSDVAMLEKNMGGSLPNNLKNDAIKAGQTGKEVDLKAIQAKYGDRAAAMYEQYMNAGSAHTKAEEYSHMDWKGMVKDQLNSALIAGLSGILMGGGSVASTYSQGRTINEDKNAKSSLYSAATQYGGAQSNRIVGRLQNQQAAGQEVSNMDTGKLASAINSDISARRGSGTYKATQEIVNSHVKQADSVIAREYKTKSDTPNSDMNYHFGMSILESAADSGSYDANDYEPSLRQAKEVKDTATKAYLDMVIPDMNGNVSEDAKKSAEIVADAAAAISTGHASTDEIMLFGTSNPENRKALESTLGIKLPTQDAATYAVLSQRNADSKIMFAKQDSNFTTARDIDEAFDLPGEAQAFNKTVKSAGKRDITQLTDYFNMFYHAGMAGRTRADAQAKFSKLSPLTSQEEFSAWYAGKKAHAYGDTAAPAKSSEPKGKSVQAKKATHKKGKYTVDKDVTEADKKKVPAAFARLAKLISKKYHVDIVLMHEIKTDGGTKVNGAHTGNTIMIAANQADTTHILEGTLMHELTHHIESLAPAEYEKMKKYVMKHWRANNKISFEHAVSNKMSQYKGTDTVHGKKDAVDEILAEWAVSILQDEKAVREFLGYDATLGQKITDAIKKFFEEFTAYIKLALGATSPAYLKASGVEAEFKKLWLGAAKAAENGTASEKNSNKKFSIASTLDADLTKILKNTFPKNTSELYLGDTSYFLTNVIGFKRLDNLMPVSEAYSAMMTEEEAKKEKNGWKYKSKEHYHGLGKDGLINSLAAAEKPIAAVVSKNEKNGEARYDRIMLITGEKDSEGNNVVVIAQPEVMGLENSKRKTINRTVTTYGKDYIQGVIMDATAQNRVLFYDKKRISTIARSGEVQFLNSKSSAYFDINIQNYLANVNYLKEKNTKLSTKPAQGNTMSDAFKKAKRKKKGADYLAAVKRGDVTAAQKMVDEAAKEAGYGTRGYHGSRESFTVFSHKDIYGGKSNSIAGIGFWFTPSKSAAQNWTDQAWWGKGEPQVYDSYLKINNPKVYETTVDPDKETKIQDIYDKLDVIEEKAKKLYDKHKYDMEEAYIFSEVSLRRNRGKADDILESKKVSFGSEEYDALKKDVTSYVEYKNEIDRLTDESLSYHYSDAYEKFKTDVYKLAGMNAEDANFGGMSRAIEGGVEQYRDKLKENLKKQGYDGMVIKNTKFDADTMGERNTQYVVFDPEQIKSADPVTYDDNGNVIPLSERFNSEKDDIRFSLPAEDSEGKTLTDDQRKYFGESKALDYNGNLLHLWHGAEDGGFTVFDPKKSDDKTSLFFTDNKDVAMTYSDGFDDKATEGPMNYPVYLNLENPLLLNGNGNAWWNNVSAEGYDRILIAKDGVYSYDVYSSTTDETYFEEGDLKGTFGKEIADAIIKKGSELTGGLEQTTILTKDGKVIEDEGTQDASVHNGKMVAGNTRAWANYAKEHGYDGVIFRDIYDEGKYSDMGMFAPSTVCIAFNSNQVKSIYNEHPTIDDDIRYSVASYSDLRNKNITPETRIPYTENGNYIAVSRGDYDALIRLQDEVKALPRGSYTNKATGYTANIIGETIKKALHPTSNNLNEYTKSYTDNLNGVVKLPGLFENAVYVDTIPTGKGKETNPQMKGYHHFVAPLYMNDTTYRALITAREKQNSDTLYVLRVEIMPNIKGTASRNTVSVGSGLRAVPSDISIADLVNNVKIYDYNKGTFNTYNGDDISFSAADDQKLTYEQETRKLAATVERLRGEMKLTHNSKPNKADIKREANYLCKFYTSNVPVQAVEDGLTEMYEILSRGNGAQKELSNADMDEFSRYAMDIAEDIVKHGGFVTDEGSEELAAAKEYFKGNHYYIPADLAADVGYKNYTEFRKLMFGYGVYVTKNEALNYPSFDGQMIEFEQEAPGMFPKGSTHTTTANVLDYTINEVLKPDTEKFVGYDVYSDEGQSVIVDIAEHIADTLELINPKRTFADRKKAEQNRAVARTNKKWKEREAKHKAYYLDKIGAMRVQMTAKLSEERAKNREKTAELKAKHKQEKADIRDKNREQISSMREKHALEKRAIREKDTEKYKNKVAALNEKSRIEKKAIRDKHTDLKNRKANIESIKGSADYLTKALLSPSDNIHLPMGYEAGIARVLYGIDFETHRMDKYAEKNGISRNVATFRRLESEYKSMIAGESENGSDTSDIVLDVGLPDIIGRLADTFDSETETLGRVRLENMDSRSLSDLRKLMSALRMSIQHINSTFYGDQQEDVRNQGEAIIEELDKRKDNTKGKGVQSVSDLLNLTNRKPIDFFEHIDSPTLMKAFNNLIAGQDQHIVNFREATEYIQSKMSDFGMSSKNIDDWHGPHAEVEAFKLGTKKTIHLTVAQKMELYALMKRKQAVGHILASGIEVDTTVYKGSKLKRFPTVFTRITYDEVQKILATLTPEQTALADSILDFMHTTCTDWGNETSRRMFGYEKFGEPDYYPIHVSQTETKSNSNPKDRTPKLINGGATKATVIGANNHIILDDFFNTVTSHIDFMSQYNAFVPALTDIERIMNYTSRDEESGNVNTSVKSIMKQKFGEGYERYISQFLKDINTAREKDNDFRGVDKLLRWMKANALAMNLRVLVQQPTSIMRANYYIDMKYLAKSASKMNGFSKKMTQRMWDICPLAYWKHLGFAQTDISRPLNDILFNRSGLYEKIAFDPYGAADDITWRTIFGAVEEETKAGMKKGVFTFQYDDEAYRKHINERCRYILDRTQVVDSTFHRAQIMRNTSALAKSVTSFMSEPLTNYNLLVNCLSESERLKEKKHTGQATKRLLKGIKVFMSTGITLSVAASLISTMRQTSLGGDDDKRKKKRFIEQWLGTWDLKNKNIDLEGSYLLNDIYNQMNPVYWLPIAGDAWDELINKVTNGKLGYAPSAQYLQLFDVMAKAVTGTQKLINGSWADTPYSKNYYYQQVTEALAAMGGFSLKNVRRDTEAVLRATVWSMCSKDYATYLTERMYSNPAKDKKEVIDTYLSLEKHDKAHAKEMYKWMTKGGIGKDDITDHIKATYKDDLDKAIKSYDAAKVNEILKEEKKQGIDTDKVKKSIKSSDTLSEDYKKTFEQNDKKGRKKIDNFLHDIGYSHLEVKSHKLAYAKGYSRYKAYLVYKKKGYDACARVCDIYVNRYPGIYESGDRMIYGIKHLSEYTKQEYNAGRWSPYSPSGKYSYSNVNDEVAKSKKKRSSKESSKSGSSSSKSSGRHYSSSGGSSRSSSSRFSKSSSSGSSTGTVKKARRYYSTATKSSGEASVRRAVKSDSRKTALSLARTYISKYGTVKYQDAEAMVEAMEKETETDDQKLAKKYGLWG